MRVSYILQVQRICGDFTEWVSRFTFDTREAAEAFAERSGYLTGYRVVRKDS